MEPVKREGGCKILPFPLVSLPMEVKKMETLKGYISNCVERDEVCEDCECRYWHDWIDTGNCVLRVKKGYELKEIGISMGGISVERVRQIEERTKWKIKMRIGREVKELLDW